MLLLAVFTIGCDQATKAVARDVLPDREPMSFFFDLVKIQYAENPGAFLSLGADMPQELRFAVFIVGAMALLIFAGWLLTSKSMMSLPHTSALTLVIAGGIGNLIDRILFGHVTDFLVLGTERIRTGVFNVADVAIMLGVALMLWPNRVHSDAHSDEKHPV